MESKSASMRAIEINSRTDRSGLLRFNYPLHKADSNVRVLILLDESEDGDEDEAGLLLKAAAGNPAFDFLKDPAEDIYSLTSGEPLDD